MIEDSQCARAFSTTAPVRNITLEETCCHSNSSERPSADADVKNSNGDNNNNDNNNNIINNNNFYYAILCDFAI